jgi:hypothetical protein
MPRSSNRSVFQSLTTELADAAPLREWMVLGQIERNYGSAVARLLVGTAMLGAALTGCAGSGGTAGSPGVIQDVALPAAPEPIQARLTVNPPDGAAGVSPSEKVTALVASGQFVQVDLRTSGGDKLDGALSPDGERWMSSKSLRPDTSYVLTSLIRSDDGQQTTTVSRFSTQSRGQQVSGKITPSDGSTVDDNEPLTIQFDKPIGDRGAVERALRVISNPTVTGQSQWRSDRELVWQPDGSWPAGSDVTVSLDIFGRQLGQDLFGAGDLRSVFHITGQSDAVAADDLAGDDSSVASSTDAPPVLSSSSAPQRTSAPRPNASTRSRTSSSVTSSKLTHRSSSSVAASGVPTVQLH